MTMARKAIHALDRVASWLARLLAGLAALSTVILMVVVTYGVVMRFVFANAQNWTDELAAFSLAWLVFLGLAHTLATDGHVRIRFFADRLSDGIRRIVETATYGIGFAFSALLFVGCLSTFNTFVKRDTHSIGGLDVPLYYPAAALLVGSAALGLVMFVRGLRVLAEGLVEHHARNEDAPS